MTRTGGFLRLAAGLMAALASFAAEPSDQVLLLVNTASPQSLEIGAWYAGKRAIPAWNVCRLRLPVEEPISRDAYESRIARPLMAFLRARRLREKILYIVTTLGVPLRITGSGGPAGESASVDSELALLYQVMRGAKPRLAGGVSNPYFAENRPFRHPDFPMYLVTRLAAFDVDDVKAMISRSLAAQNRGKVVLDLRSDSEEDGDRWLRQAARLLPRDRVVIDESEQVIYGEKDVIGYASWGSNDRNRKQRLLGFQWLPGAIATEYVSTDARTFRRPPDSWNISTWADSDKPKWFVGSPQSLSADFIHEGASGASGHVDEPYLQNTPRPNFLFPAYLSGRNLAESFYTAIPLLSWRNVVIGDPLCRLR